MIYVCTVSYDGYNYAGWQKQENALGIQEVIETHLSKMLKKEVTIVASGRTDAHVHALGQVFHFEHDIFIEPRRIKKALNALLPEDIRIVDARIESDDFHARFSAKKKQYEYICTFDDVDPFVFKYKTKIYGDLDIDKIKVGAKCLEGTHDFTSFSSSKIDPRKPRIKTIDSIKIWQEDKDLHFLYVGNGFLRYQVRMMTGTLLALGKHKIDVVDVKRILEAKNKEACRYNAPAQGLYLVKVEY